MQQSKYTEPVYLSEDQLQKIKLPVEFHLGAVAAYLWQTKGFPFELFRDMCMEHGLKPEREAFDWYMEQHRNRSRRGNNIPREEVAT